MKIIYLGNFRLPNCDAAAVRVLNVARSMRFAGHEVRFLSWGGVQRIKDKCEDGVYRVDGFPYVITNELDAKGGIAHKAVARLCRGNITKKILKEKLGEYDAVISYGGVLSLWLMCFCKRNNIYFICDLTEWHLANEFMLFERPLYYIKTRYIYPRIKNKILISSYLNQAYKESYNIIVPATCDASEAKWHHDDDTLQAKLGIFDGITLIYAGTPAKKDLLHLAIRAVDRLANEGASIRFLILGCDRNYYLKNYSCLLPQGTLNDKIQFLGRVAQDDVPSYYAFADFMVLLREQNRKSNAGFPTKFAESFTSGTPVIANITSDLGHYLKDGETGFVVEAPSEEAIYRTLKEKILTLNRNDIEVIKNNVRESAKLLDYHAYIEPLKVFIDNLV